MNFEKKKTEIALQLFTKIQETIHGEFITTFYSRIWRKFLHNTKRKNGRIPENILVELKKKKSTIPMKMF